MRRWLGAIGVCTVLLVLGIVRGEGAAGQGVDSVSGTVKAYTLEDCQLVPGTCQGSLVIQSGAETHTFAIPKGTLIKHGERHWILLNELRPRDPVTVTFVTREGQRHAQVVRLERRPLPGEMGSD